MTDTATTKGKVGLNAEEQLKFLISCIRFCENGKVNFASVAEDCDIVTRAAASKRLERLCKSHDFSLKGIAGGDRAGHIATPIKSTPPAKSSNSAFKPINSGHMDLTNEPDDEIEAEVEATPTPAKKKARVVTKTAASKKGGATPAKGKRKASDIEKDDHGEGRTGAEASAAQFGRENEEEV